MVKIAIVGGTGGLAREVTDTLLATKKHELVLLSRNDTPTSTEHSNVKWVKVNYKDVEDLAITLQGVHTLMSFITPQTDEANVVQKTLMQAAVKAGVKRFAPSEWVGSGVEHMEWYWGKGEVRQYLEDINKNNQVLEYCLFQPGWFTDYLAYPHQSAKYFRSFPVCIDFANCRAFFVEGSEKARVTFTTVKDFAEVVAKAVGYEGEWPAIGGIKGSEMSVEELIALGKRVRGKPFAIEKLKRSDLEAGIVSCSWIPKVDHPAVGDYEDLGTKLNISVLLSLADGDLNVGDQWNKLLPDHTFVNAEDFLRQVWVGQ